MIDTQDRVKIERSILLLQLAVNLLGSVDLNDEDQALLNELMGHSVVQAALERKRLQSIEGDASVS